MEIKKKLKFLSLFCAGLLLISVSISPLYAMEGPTSTPTPTITPTTSVSVTPTVTGSETPSDTDTPTETPSPTPIATMDAKFAVDKVLKVGTQYPWNKQIPVTIELTPRSDAQSLEVRWPQKTGFVITPRGAMWQNVKKDQTYSITFTFEPTTVGKQSLSADVILTTFQTNYVDSIPLEITLNGEKIVQPVSDQYRMYETTMYVVLGVILFVLIPLAIFFGIMYIKNVLIPKWIQARLNEPI